MRGGDQVIESKTKLKNRTVPVTLTPDVYNFFADIARKKRISLPYYLRMVLSEDMEQLAKN